MTVPFFDKKVGFYCIVEALHPRCEHLVYNASILL